MCDLLLDEMHIRQDPSREMIGFCSLGEVNDQLLAFERSLSVNEPSSPKLAKTMMVFMVRGLFKVTVYSYTHAFIKTSISLISHYHGDGMA